MATIKHVPGVAVIGWDRFAAHQSNGQINVGHGVIFCDERVASGIVGGGLLGSLMPGILPAGKRIPTSPPTLLAKKSRASLSLHPRVSAAASLC